MSTVLNPVRERAVIEIEPTPEQKVIMEMIKMVKDGKWCRNILTDELGRHCALGMINPATRRVW